MGKEKPAETRLITELRRVGFAADHMDCDVSGFPDILAAMNNVVVPIEVKDGARGGRIKDLFESTQPAFYERWRRAGNSVYIAVAFGDAYFIYDGKKALRLKLMDPNALVSSLPLLFSGDARATALIFFKHHVVDFLNKKMGDTNG